MSEETTLETPKTEEKPLTRADVEASLKDMVTKKDSEGLRETIERLEAASQNKEQPKEIVQDNPLEEVPDKKTFDTEVRGANVSHPDSDGYLEYGKFGRMKKAHVHLKEEIKHTYGMLDEAKKAAQAANQARMDAEAKLKEVETKQPPAAAPPSKVEDQPILTAPEKPKYPEALPASSADWDDGHQELFKDYLVKQDKWRGEISEYVENVAKQTTTTKIPDEVKTRLEKAEAALAKYEETSAKDASRLKNEEIERLNKDYWANIDNFRNKHNTEFGDPEKTKTADLHDDIVKWVKKVVSANGVQEPYTPENPESPEWVEYRNNESNIISKFLSDDPDTVKVVEGSEVLKPPEGYREYYKLLDLMQYKDDLIKSGELTGKASLHSAWLIKADREGVLDQGVQDIATNAVANASEAVLNTLQKDYKENAVTLPNDKFQNPTGETTKEDVEKLLKMSPFELLHAGPEVRELHTKITEQLSNKG